MEKNKDFGTEEQDQQNAYDDEFNYYFNRIVKINTKHCKYEFLFIFYG